MMRRTAVAVALFASGAPALGSSSQLAMNPIRKVVTLLQQMQTKVTEEGEKEKDLYEKFVCYCQNGAKDLDASMGAATEKIESLSTDIQESSEKKAKAESDVKNHQAERAAAIKTMKESTALREKEAGVYAALKAEYGANAAAMEKAIKALEKGMGGAFLQSNAADVLRRVASGSFDDDHQTLLAFLSSKDESEYAPQSGQITGILKQMSDEMAAGYTEATETEEAAIKAYEELMAAKKKEKAHHSEQIETKMARIAELGIAVAQMKNDAEDTQEALAADAKFKEELKKGCDSKAAEWEERTKLRAEELVALADTIKVLNDDDALELFKSTLPSASSFMQIKVSAQSMRARALAEIKQGLAKANRGDRHSLDLISLALHGKKVGFEKVVAMIDKMVEDLHAEQGDDDNKKEYCEEQLDTTDDKKKQLERKVSDHETEIANAEEAIATLTEEIKALTAGIKALDKSVAEATENRKAENEEYKQLMASNTAAKQVLDFAKNRLNKFYNPKLYKAAPKRELSKEDRIAVNMGGTPPPTEAPGGIAGTGIKVFAQISQHVQLEGQDEAAPAPPPETFGAYTKKSEENNGVIEMINMLIKDLDKEMTEATAEEKDAQGDYEQMMADSADKRAADSKSLSEKTGAKADTEAALVQHNDDLSSTKKELGATLEYIASLHGECDWMLEYHPVRKEARDSEIDSLGKAKAVLSGADYSLLQQSRSHSLRGSKA